MNKKFLSAILFGALMVTSTGTFVSCKDYDDDINRIDTELGELKSQLSALQTKVDNGSYVTAVTKTADGKGITFAFSKGDPVTVTLDVKDGEKGEAGSKITIDPVTGKISIDGKDTGFFAVKNTETAKFAVPEIGEDGFWYVVNKEGKLEATPYKASPITALQDPNTQAWIVKIWNAETKKYDEISLPTAASLITDFEVMGIWNGEGLTSGKKTDETAEAAADETKKEESATAVNTYLSIYKSKALTADQVIAWQGPKKLVKDACLVSSSDNMLVRIAPSSLDATGTEFNIVNSKNHSPLGISLNAAAKFDGVLTRAAGDAGLYTVGVKTMMFIAKDAKIDELDGTDLTKTLFALQDVTGGFTSPFTVGIQEGKAISVTDIKVNETKVGIKTSESPKFKTLIIDLNKDNTVTFDDPAGVYDAYITYSDADKKLFGLTHDNEKMTFKASLMPDIITKATFDITIHYLTVSGEAKTRDVEVKVNSSLSETIYDVSHKLIADKDAANPNYFAINLQTMKDKMGETNYAIFTKNVDLTKTSYVYTYVGADGKTVTVVDAETATAKAKGITEYIVKENKADKEKTVSSVADANFIKFAIDNNTASQEGNFEANTKYTIAVTFKDAAKEKLATIKVNFILTIPSLKDLLTIEPSVYNAEAKSLFAYMTEGEDIKGNETLKAPKYTFKNGFKAPYAQIVADNSIEFAVADVEYAKDKKVTSVASIKVPENDAKEKQYADQYIVLSKDGDTYPVYAKDIKVYIKSAKYLDAWNYPINEKNGEWYSFNIRLMSPITCDQASIAPADGVSIKIPATGNKKEVAEKDFKALTYNKQPFGIFANKVVEKDGKDADPKYEGKWENPYVSDVQFKSTNSNVFVVEGSETETGSEYVSAVKATINEKGAVTKESHIFVSPKQIENETTENMEVVLTDMWGFTKKATVAVTVQRDK